MRDPCKENSAGAVFVRLGGELYDRLEDFRRRQAKIPHRSEALRSLIERALTASDSAAVMSRRGHHHELKPLSEREPLLKKMAPRAGGIG
jgi:hypothetical protein